MNAADEHGGHDGRERAEARGEDQRAGRSLVGANADQEHEQAERDQSRERGLLHRGGKCGRLAGLVVAQHARPLPHTFSTSGRPKMPVGRKMSTMMRTQKAATSLYSIEK